MVYKKYVYKKGKKFGPYYYESYRVGNKVKKRYLGSDLATENPRKESSHKLTYFFVVLGIVALVVLAFYFINFNTGRVVLQLDDSYKLGEKVSGNFNLILKKGELIPSSSLVKIKLNNQEKTISLSDLISNEKISGDFYAENLNLQGQGEGFGVIGTRLSYPDIDFTLVISKDKKQEQPVETPVEVPGQISQETPAETPIESTQETATETTSQETPETQTETQVQDQSQDSSPQIETITTETTSQETSNIEAPAEPPPVPVVESPAPAEPSPITAQVIKENPNKIEVSGRTSKNQVFTYNLEEGELAEIKQNSVSINGKKIDDNLISFSQSGNQVTVSTSYSEEEQGFGQNYLQDETSSFSINLEQFEILAEEGTLDVSVEYSGTTIIQVTKEIKLSKEKQNKKEENESSLVTPEINETIETNLTIPEINITNFTLQEINITNITISNETLENVTIGNVSIETIQYQARIGQEVRWKKTIIKPQEENLTINLPKETRNISVKKIEEAEKASDITREVRVSGITGSAIQDTNWLKNLFRLTGRVIEETNITSEAVQVEIPSNSSQVEIEYYTPAPEAFEFNITNGKRILVTAPELNYTNVLAYTEIPEEWKIKVSSSLSLSWFEDDNSSLKQQWNFEAFDFDNNSLIDYIEWNVPHLSNQSFELNNLSSSSVSSDVVCEEGGIFCHSALSDPNLVFYLPFDINGTNSIANETDWTSYNRDATRVANAHWHPIGKYKGSVKLDGTGDYLTIPFSQEFNISRNNISVSLWFNTSTQQRNLVDKRSSGAFDSDFTLWEWSSTQILGGNGPGYVTCTVATTTNSNWHHVALTGNRTHWTIYYEGAYACSGAYGAVSTTSGLISIGHDVANGGFDFAGHLDEVMFFNRTLSATEISQIYNAQFSRFVSSGNLTLNQTITSGHNDVEITTYNNNPSSTNLSLSICHATSCTSSQNMTNGTKKSFAISNPTSLLYMNFSFLTDSYNFFSPILMTNVSVNIFGETAPKFVFNKPTPPSGVNHSTTQIINISIVESSLTNFSFNWNSTNYSFYDQSLLTMFSFNNNSLFGDNATSVIDLSWQSRNGTFLGNAYMNSTGKYSGALQLDGTGDYVSSPIYPLKNNFTFEMWIYPAVMGARDEWASSSTASGVSGWYWHNNYDTNDFNYVGMELSSGSWTNCKGLAVGSITTNQWHHVAFTKSPTTGVRIFYDGANVSACTTMKADIIDEGTSLFIGRGYPDGNNRYIQGAVDEVRVWNRTLTDDDIKQSYLASLVKFNSTLWGFTTSPNLTLGQNNSYQAIAKNSLGLENSTEIRELNITDYGYPRITIVSPTNTTYSSNSILFNLTIGNGADSCKFSLNNWADNISMTKLTATNFNFTNSSIIDGSYLARFWCNNSDNVINDTTQIGFSIDSYPPLVAFSNPTPDSGNSGNNNQTFNLTFIESNLNEFIWQWNSTNYSFYNSSLLLLYNFDNRSRLGENNSLVVDSSLYGNNGIVSGSPIFNISGGIYDGFLNFDGLNDYITVNPLTSLFLTQNYSIFFWIKVAGGNPSSDQEILFKRNSTGTNYQILLAKGQAACGSKYNLGFYNGASLGCGNAVLAFGRWYFIGFVTNATGTTFYVNDSRDAYSNLVAGTYNAPLIIGSADPTGIGTTFDFNGSLDNLMFFNRTLTREEVSQLYRSGLTKINSTLWQFNSNQSNLVYGVNYTYQAIVKDFANLVNSTAMRELNITNSLIISIISPTNTTYITSTILFNITLNNNGNNCKFSLDNWANNVTMQGLTATNFNFTNSSIADGNYIARFWCNDTDNRIDSSAQINFTVSTAGSNIYFTSPTPPSGINYSNNHTINISIDENSLRQFIWNWNSTNYSIYNSSLVLMQDFNNISAIGDNYTYSADSALYNNFGTISGNTFWNCTNSRYGCSGDFDGADDWIVTSFNGTYNKSELSVCAWAYKRVNVSYASLVTDYVNGGGGRNFILGYEFPNNQLAFGIGDGDNIEWVYNDQFTEKAWHHVCGTYSNITKELALYIDGVNSSVIALVVNKTGKGNSGGSYIGTLYGAGGYDFNGLIDEVRVWNRALSSQDVKEMYNSNLYKYDSSNWQFTSNHSNLRYGSNNTYYAVAKNSLGIENSTEIRELNISLFSASDTTPPYVAILGPTNTTYTYSNINLNITNSSDAVYVWYMNSTGNFSYTEPLYFNLTNGAWTWYAYANDSLNNVNETFVSFYVNYTAPDTTAPTIILIFPGNSTTNSTANLVDFYYNVSGSNNIENCSLIVNNVINLNSVSITKDTTMNLTSYLANGNYNWSVNCTDSSNNIGASETMINLNINYDNPQVDSCKNLNTSNQIYTMTGDVSSNTTCFNITASNVTLNCNGFNVNYTRNGTTGYGVFVLGQNFSTINNCTIGEANYSGDDYKYGIYLVNSHNSSIKDNRINTIDYRSHSIVLSSSNSNNLSYNTITPTGSEGQVINLGVNSMYNIIESNQIRTSQSRSYAVALSAGSNFTKIINNNISSAGSLTISLYYVTSSNCVVSNNTLYNSGTGGIFYLASGSHSNTISNNSITGASAGVYFDSNANLYTVVSGNFINGTGDVVGVYPTSNCNFTTIDKNTIETSYYGLDVISSHNNITNNRITAIPGSDGAIALVGNTGGGEFNYIYNNTIITHVATGILFNQQCLYNKIYSNNITGLGAAHGIYFTGSCDHNEIYSNYILTAGSSSRSIFLTGGSQNNTFSNITIMANSSDPSNYALEIDDGYHNFTFSDSIINASTDVFIDSVADGGNWNFTNVTKPEGNIPINFSWNGGKGNLNVHWYLQLNISNSSGMVENVNSSLRDLNQDLKFSELTNTDGQIVRKTLQEYWKNATASNYTSNYNLTASKTGYNNYENSSINLTINLNLNLVMGEIILDTTSPYFTTIPANVSMLYGQGFQSTFIGTDETSFDSFKLGNWSNYFVINKSGYIQNITSNLGVGIYIINITLNDSSGNTNITWFKVEINKSDPSPYMTIAGTSSIIYPQIISNPSTSNTLFGADDCSFSLGNSDGLTQPYGVELSPTTYSYSTLGCTNWTAGSKTLDVTILKNETYVLAISGTTPITYGTSTDVVGSNCPSELVCSLDKSNVVYSASTITFNYSTIGNANYSANSITKDIVIDKATQSLTTLLNSLTSNLTLNYPTQINASFYNNNTEMIVSINNKIITPHLNYTYGSSHYVVNFTAINSENYSAFINFMNFTINARTPTLTLLINGSSLNQTANQSVQTNVSAYVDNSEQTIVLLNNSIDMTSSNHLFNTLVNGSYNFTAYVVASENYTYSTLTRWSHIINNTGDTAPPEIILVSPSEGISAVTSAYNFTFNVSDESNINNCSLIIDNSIVSTLESISKTYTNGIYYSGLAVSSHTWSVNCTDIYGNIGNSSTRSLIVTSVPVTPTTTPSAGGGGGGGASVLFNLRANPGFINLNSIINQRLNGTIEITNLGTSTVYLDISAIKLEGILDIDKTLILGSGETKTLEYFVNSPKDAGLYIGKIEFAYGGDSLQLPVTLNVKTEISLFDISLNLPQEYKKITKGGNIKAQINLLQAGLQEKADVTLVYMIKDFDSNTYLKESETIMVYKEKSYEKEFQISTFEPGNYVIGAEVIYSGGVATASSNFDVVEKKPFSFWILLVVIAAFIIIIIVAVRYKKIVADRIKNSKKKR